MAVVTDCRAALRGPVSMGVRASLCSVADCCPYTTDIAQLAHLKASFTTLDAKVIAAHPLVWLVTIGHSTLELGCGGSL
jgi:hypothetical protein